MAKCCSCDPLMNPNALVIDIPQSIVLLSWAVFIIRGLGGAIVSGGDCSRWCYYSSDVPHESQQDPLAS